MTIIDRRILMTGMAGLVAGCASSNPSQGPQNYRQTIPANAFVPWNDSAPYALFPGDEIDVTLPSAQELNRQLIVGLDGRISLPMIGHVMAAERTLSQLESDISNAYGEQLLRPAVEVTLRRPILGKIWIDGQVRNPGAFDMPTDRIDAYQAIILAGGAIPGSRPSRAALIRRSEDGQRMMTIVDLRSRTSGNPLVQRGDIIFVPRSSMGELAAFFTQIRNALPVGFSYALNGRWD